MTARFRQSSARSHRPISARRLLAKLSVALWSVLSALISTPATVGAEEKFSFAVVGHLRSWQSGRVNSLLDDTLAELQRLRPELLFLVGDSIWGDVMLPLTDPQVITRDWDDLDSRLGELEATVYRVPGNHDVHDPVTRDIFFARYGAFPRSVSANGSLFLLLNSTYVPQGDDPARKFITTRRLTESQVRFLQKEISNTSAQHIFLFMHHVLWWHEDAPWWFEVHPLLVGSNVRAVFSGDLGPTKFSHQERDGIQYIRTALEDDFTLEHTGALEAMRSSAGEFLLSQQFDNFVLVEVDGDRIHYQVVPVGIFSSGKHSPSFWRLVRGPSAVNARWDYDPAAEQDSGLWKRLVGNRKRLAIVAAIAAFCFIAGSVSGAYWRSLH